MPLSEKLSLLPQGNNGIAARYPGDGKIENDPAVVFHDDFESGDLSLKNATGLGSFKT